MSKVLNVILLALVIVLSVMFLFSLHRPSMMDAENDATIRILREFHDEFLAEKGVDTVEYQAALEALQRKHSGWGYLKLYVRLGKQE